MANKNANVRKPLSSSAKGLICLVVLAVLTVFVTYIALAGLSLDAQGINKLLPWVPTSSANWPDSLPVSRTLGGASYTEYTYTLPEGADESVLQDAVKTMRTRLNQMGEADAEVFLKDDVVRMELRNMSESRLSSMRSFAIMGGQFVFSDTNGNEVLTQKDIDHAEVAVNYNSTRTSYTVSLNFTVNKDGEAKLAATDAYYLSVTCDGDTVTSYALISDNKISATIGYNSDAYNTAANLAFLLNYGSVDVTLNRSNDGYVAASAGSVLSVVLIVCGLLLVCGLVYMIATGRLTGISAFLSVWCALILGLFFVATIVIPSSNMLNVGCLVAILLGILVALYSAVTRTDAISKQIGEGNTPKQATKLGYRAAAKNIWIVHGAVVILAMILMIFRVSQSTGYALAAMVTASAMCTLVMRAFQFCFTMISNKPALFGKVK